MLKQIVKAPVSVLDVGIIWGEWLNTTDTIASSEWRTDNPELIVDSDTNNTTSTRTLVRGGNLGGVYKVFNKITTTQGLVDERYIQVYVQQQSAGC